MHATTIAVDLAKSVFQVSFANKADRIIDRKRLTRSQFERLILTHKPTTIVMEACSSAHHWCRLADAQGHQTRQLHPFYVKPYVRRNKTDSADADALIRANRDPHLLPVPTKHPDQQALQGIHRTRQQLIQTRTQRINLARSLASEFGLTLPRGSASVSTRLRHMGEDLPQLLTTTFTNIVDDIDLLAARIGQLDRELCQIAKDNETATKLLSIPGVGVTTATALLASVPDIHCFKRGKQFAAWLGITPKEHSSGNTRRLGRISKQGNEYLRTLLIHGARSLMLQAHRRDPEARDPIHHWAINLEQTRHRNIVAVATANKLARIIWACWHFDRPYLP